MRSKSGHSSRNAPGIEERRPPSPRQRGEQRDLATEPRLVVTRDLQRGHDPIELAVLVQMLGAVNGRGRPLPRQFVHAPRERTGRQLRWQFGAQAAHITMKRCFREPSTPVTVPSVPSGAHWNAAQTDAVTNFVLATHVNWPAAPNGAHVDELHALS